MQIAALVFDAITPLDIVGPIEVLARMPAAEIVIVGKQRGPVRDPRTHWTLTAEASIGEVPSPDVLVLPGGAGVRPLCVDEPILEWLRHAHRTTSWTTSVCQARFSSGRQGSCGAHRHHALGVRELLGSTGHATSEAWCSRKDHHLGRRVLRHDMALPWWRR
jgi:putative intracellular protease/amidase